MDDTNVKLSIDLGSKVLQKLNKVSHQLALTVDIGPNVMLAIKYIVGSLIVYKSIDSLSTLIMYIGSSSRSKRGSDSNNELKKN